MKHSTSAKLFWIATILLVVGIILAIVGASMAGGASSSSGSSTGAGIVVLIGVLAYIAAAVVYFIGWLGALIKTAKLSRWGWFVCILLLGWFAMLAYVFAGPKDAQVPAYAPAQR